MSRIVRFAALVAALTSCLAALSASASAVTWDNSGDTAFTATANANTLSVTGASGLVCPGGGTATGTTTSTPFGTPIWTAMSGTFKFSNCQLGTSGWTYHCDWDLTDEETISSPHIITGDIHFTCGAWLAGVRPCLIHATAHALYIEPIPPNKFGQIFITTGGSIVTTNGSGGTCPLGTNDRGHMSVTTFTINNATGGPSPHLGPVFTRTS